jgi:hypothetical protein
MSGNQEMFQAFQDFAATMRRVQMGNAIQEAQKKVEAIRSNQELNEFEQIKAQQAVASMTASSILANGGDAAMAQQARLSLAPDIQDQHFQALQATGKGTIAEAQQQLHVDALKQEKDMLKYKNDLEMERQRQHDPTMERIAAGKKDTKPVPPTVSNKLSELSDSLSQLKRLREGFDANEGAIGPYDQFKTSKLAGPPGAGLIPGTLNADESVYRKDVSDFFNQYRKVITGAAASMPELKGLLRSVPNEGDDQTVFAKGLDMHIKKVEQSIQSRLKLLKAQGRDTADLELALGVGAQSAPAGGPPPAPGAGPSSAPAMGTDLSAFIK